MTTPSPIPPPTLVWPPDDVTLPDHPFLTMDDLPDEFEDEEGLPGEFHVFFGILLWETFRPTTFPPDRCYCARNMYLYFRDQGKIRGLRPDWMGIVDVPHLYAGERLRLSYVIEAEGRAPLIIAEALSKRTLKTDPGRGAVPRRGAPRKWDVYESVLKIPYYIVLDDETEETLWFRHDGVKYVEERPENERLWLPEAGLAIGPWRGAYYGRMGLWLRFYDAQGALIPTNAEREAQARAAKEAALQELERLKAQLRNHDRHEDGR